MCGSEERGEHQPPSVPKKTARGEVVALEQLLRGALELAPRPSRGRSPGRRSRARRSATARRSPSSARVPCSVSTSSSMRCTTTGARPSDSSSMSRISGSWISTRASASICCWPPDRLRADCFVPLARARGTARAPRRRARRPRRVVPPSSRALTARFCATVRLGNTPLPPGQLHDAHAAPAARARRR